MTPMGLPVIVSIPPLGSKQWTWDQKDWNSVQVPAGIYEARITYSDSIGKKTLKTPFQIDQVTLAVSGNATPGGQQRNRRVEIVIYPETVGQR